MEAIYLAAVRMTPGIGDARLKTILDYFGTARRFWKANADELEASKTVDASTLQKFILHRKRTDPQVLAADWERRNIRLCIPGDEQYPLLLSQIYDPPLVLFYRGTLPAGDRIIGVVGSRRATVYGRNAAEHLAGGLAAAGIWVASGAARGIDTAAHQGALKQGKTIAVLGCGVDVVYPAENKKLLDQIAEQGAVLSEYPPGTPPHQAYFPARNRIINGLSRGVIVVEAAERSGALITADMALEEGRDVYAVPGSIFSAASVGANRLLKQGAKPVCTVQDVLEEYGWEPNALPIPDDKELSESERSIYQCLNYENPLSAEELVEKTGQPVAHITYLLLQLELGGWVVEFAGRRYVRAVREGVSR